MAFKIPPTGTTAGVPILSNVNQVPGLVKGPGAAASLPSGAVTGLSRLIAGRAHEARASEKPAQGLRKWAQLFLAKARELISHVVKKIRDFSDRHIFVKNRESYRALGLKPGATPLEIDRARFAMYRKYDRSSRIGNETTKKAANAKLTAVNRAYATLTKK